MQSALVVGLFGSSCASCFFESEGRSPSSATTTAVERAANVAAGQASTAGSRTTTDPTEARRAFPPAVRIGVEHQNAIDELVAAAIDRQSLPGCVVLIGRRDGPLFRRAYGDRRVVGGREAMSEDTIFDLASLTKGVATTTAVLQLVERGKVDLDAPAARYLPEFADQGKHRVTVRDLLLHRGGLRAVNALDEYDNGRDAAIEAILRAPPIAEKRRSFHYSDLGFIVLAELVSKVAGRPFDELVRETIFEPLAMRDTFYRPAADLRPRIAPTTERDGVMIRGQTQDPRAFRLGGVAGNAGLFSTADDLARFARALLGGGELDGQRILQASSVEAMTEPVELPEGARRGLGWDMSPLAAQGLSSRSFGHGGYTGTWMWVDPKLDLFVIVLSNRVHVDPQPRIRPLTLAIAREAVRALATATNATDANVLLGIDVLRREHFSPLAGRRVGLITNSSGRARDGQLTADLLVDAEEVDLQALFAPEHGLFAGEEGSVGDARYRGVPVYSLFGSRRSPDAATLGDLDLLLVDLQDVGVRYYTYASTLAKAMDAAASVDLELWVLDRPNPLGGEAVDGTISQERYASFVNHHPLPIRHGLTIGELAKLLAAERSIAVKLDVVPLEGWRRSLRWEQTGLRWVPPSPNLRHPHQALLYAAVGLVEGTNVSVGRGTPHAFEVVGAPWARAATWARSMRAAHLPGLRVDTTRFIPRVGPHRGLRCSGVRLFVEDAEHFDAFQTAMALFASLRAVHGERFDLDAAANLIADDPLLEALRRGADLSGQRARVEAARVAFDERVRRYRLYP